MMLSKHLLCFTSVVGTTFQAVPWKQLAMHKVLELIPEPDNVHDQYAVKVMFRKHHIGYITAKTWYNGKQPLNQFVFHDIHRGEYDYYGIISKITGGVEGKENQGINMGIYYVMKKNMDYCMGVISKTALSDLPPDLVRHLEDIYNTGPELFWENVDLDIRDYIINHGGIKDFHPRERLHDE